jgi:hypothetical protein
MLLKNVKIIWNFLLKVIGNWFLAFFSFFRKYIVAVCLLVVYSSVIMMYFYKFGSFDISKLSKDPAHWGQLGDYIGGLLNPILSFATIIYLIKANISQRESSELQKLQIQQLLDESATTRKIEKYRNFDNEFFELISSQKLNFDNFKINVGKNDISKERAVAHMEDCIATYRHINLSDDDIKKRLLKFDEEEKLYNMLRVFFLIVKLIFDRLSDENGFSQEEREKKIEVLIAFTDFSILRVVLISMQFFSYYPSRYLKENKEFNNVLVKLKLNIQY